MSVVPGSIEHMFDDGRGVRGAPSPGLESTWPGADGRDPVQPSAELLAWWDQADARYGEPECPAVYGELVAERLGDHELVEEIAALERMASWARARQLAAVRVLSRRASMNPFWPVRVGQPNIAAEEVAARLGASRAVGRELVEAARLFSGPLMATAEALERGDIDWGKARVVIGALRHAAGPVAVDVQDRVLPGAGRRTHSQLRGDLQRALIAVDPGDAELRQVAAVDERRVCRPRVLPDGMAGIWAVLPADRAAAIDAALNDAARAARRAGDPRTTDQLRADAYSGALLSAGSPAGCGPGDAGARGRARINVTVALTTLLGLDETPGELAGYGAITAQTARRLAATGTWRRLVTDPLTGTVLDVGRRRYHPPDDLAEIVRARDRTCLSPVCAAAARGCDLDHREPFRPDGTGGATSADNLGPLCRRDHLLKTHAGWHLDRDETATFTWTTPTGHTYPYRSEPPPGHEPAGDPLDRMVPTGRPSCPPTREAGPPPF